MVYTSISDGKNLNIAARERMDMASRTRDLPLSPSIRVRAAATLAAAILSTAPLVFPQTYPFQKYTTADGLSHAGVRKVFQDSRGVLWFGTHQGLDSYDGRTFRNHLRSISRPFSVREIFEDTSGILWIGTYGSGLLRINPTNAFAVSSVSKDSLLRHNVTAIIRDSLGAIWVGSDDGVFVFLPDGRRIRVNSFKDAGEIYSLIIDTHRTLWVGTNGGLYVGHVDSHENMEFRRMLEKPVRSLLLRRNGDVIAGTSGRDDDRLGFVCRINEESLDTLLSYQMTHSLIKAQSLCEDDEGRLWIGTQYGVYVIAGRALTPLHTKNGLPNENIYDIMQDAEGTIWSGTENGAFKLARPVIVNYGMREGLSGYVVLSGARDRGGALWFGMWNGLNRIDQHGRVTSWTEANGLPHHTVRSISEDSTGTIFVGTLRGLAVVKGGIVARATIPGLPDTLDVWSLYCDSENVLWIGGVGRLFHTRYGSRVGVIECGNEFASAPVVVHCCDNQNRLWFSAGSTAGFLDHERKIARVGMHCEQPDLDIYSIRPDDGGTLWFCTNRGLGKLVEDSLLFVTSADGLLPGNPVYFRLKADNHVWFGTDHGILSWDGRNTSHLTTADGLASDIVTLGICGFDGSLWLGTHGGVSALDSSSLAHEVPVPVISVDSALAHDGTKAFAERSDIPYDDRTMLFRFNALSFVAERMMSFQWMVEGFDGDWQPPRHEREVRYTNLGPGVYVFRVRAANRNGGWSPPASFSFTIDPPYWRTWWFLSLSALFFAGLLSIAYRYRVAQLLKVERMRRRIAADLHDDIASSLSSIGIYATVIQQQIQGLPDQTRSLLDRIRELSRETTENIGLIVWSVDPRQDALGDVFRYFQRHATQLCQAASVEFTAKLPDGVASLLLTPEQRRTLFLILKEALNNALRHSRCTRIDFSGSLQGQTLHLLLIDNGCGFNADQVKGHGVSNMRARGSAIRALVEVNSQPGKGTAVAISLRMT